jgi:hypothetical protein
MPNRAGSWARRQKNGVLLSLAESREFEVFLTMDKGLEYEQNLSGRKIAIIILRAQSNRLVDLLPHLPACISIMRSIGPGQVIRVGGTGVIGRGS